MYSMTLWKGLYEKKPTYELTWNFETLCRALSKPRPRPKDKKYLPLWSPNRFVPVEQRVLSDIGSVRLKENVESLSCLVLDYDEGETIEEAKKKWEKYTFILYTSFNHSKKLDKFRVVLPLLKPVLAKNWLAAWRWAELHSGLTIDTKCKDPNRLYFFPCNPAPEEPSHFYVNQAKTIDLSHLRYEPPPPRVVPRFAGAIQTEDPAWRESVGLLAGGRRVSDRIRGITCPKCGRKEVWWLIRPDSWSGACCNRRNSCGWAGGILQAIATK